MFRDLFDKALHPRRHFQRLRRCFGMIDQFPQRAGRRAEIKRRIGVPSALFAVFVNLQIIVPERFLRKIINHKRRLAIARFSRNVVRCEQAANPGHLSEQRFGAIIRLFIYVCLPRSGKQAAMFFVNQVIDQRLRRLLDYRRDLRLRRRVMMQRGMIPRQRRQRQRG